MNASRTVVVPFIRKRKGLDAFCNIPINDERDAISGTANMVVILDSSNLE